MASEPNEPREISLARKLWSAVTTGLVLGRVTMLIALWLLLFLAVFWGYLLIPAIILFGFVLIFGTLDIVRARRRRASNQ
ncbi:MAG: hypothetical protein HY331_19075 [Chloroflexi bacterium]|nr:hypothetical protein [Chloroflexota bacterium]